MGAGQITHSVIVKLTTGSALNVRLSDASKFLAKLAGETRPSVLVMVATLAPSISRLPKSEAMQVAPL